MTEIAKLAAPISRDLIKEIAMDIGKDVVAHIETMYQQAIKATSSTFRLSVRNCIYNKILAALEVTDEREIIERLARHKQFRREQKAMWKRIRETDWEKRRAAKDVPGAEDGR